MAVALAGMIVSNCAATYPYKYYSLWLDTSTLAGPDVKDDLPLSRCNNRGSCIVLFSEEHRRVRESYLRISEENNLLKRKCGAKCK